MVKVVLFIAMSLDGYVADQEGSIEFLSNVEQREEDTTYEEFYKNVEAVVLGRTTYDQITTELSVDNFPYSNVDSYVLSSKDFQDTEHIFFKNEAVNELIPKLKEKYTKTIWIVGGSSIIKPLIEQGLIDEYQITIIPYLLGKGIPLFNKSAYEHKLSLKSSHIKNEMVYLTYTRI